MESNENKILEDINESGKPVVQNKSNNKKWYVIQVASNSEKIIKSQILQKAEEENLEHQLEEIFIPSYPSTVMMRGKKQNIEKRIMPGYIFIKMNLNVSTIGLIKSIKKVSKFLGGGVPASVTNDKIEQIKQEVENIATQTAITPFNVGEAVEIISGPFNRFNGNIKTIYPEKNRLEIAIHVFGRENVIEIDNDSVRKVNSEGA